jgi:hypothetical protein
MRKEQETVLSSSNHFNQVEPSSSQCRMRLALHSHVRSASPLAPSPARNVRRLVSRSRIAAGESHPILFNYASLTRLLGRECQLKDWRSGHKERCGRSPSVRLPCAPQRPHLTVAQGFRFCTWVEKKRWNWKERYVFNN